MTNRKKGNLISIFILFVSFLLGISSAWSLGTFLRLGKASQNYSSDQEFNNACQINKGYVEIGKTIAIVLVVLSVLIIIGTTTFFIRQIAYVS